MPERRQIAIEGVVQGVGFRPTVYQVAVALSLTGCVYNDERGVVVELQGEPETLDLFRGRLSDALPPGARIDRFESQRTDPTPAERDFRIVASRAAGSAAAAIVPDRSVCRACLEELRTPTDRRYRYPFITCTHCGPRYTIALELPYDRARTTMASFPLCDACRREYEDPLDRRYHAEPIACPQCGPRVWLVDGTDAPARAAGSHVEGERAIERAGQLLRAGAIVAIKGIGGFHLAVDATSAAAVRRLRERKRRPRKPFALMVRDLETAERLVELDDASRRALGDPTAPIVLAPARKPSAGPTDASPGGPTVAAEDVAPGLSDLGVMLPYSPLHHLLMDGAPPVLVMTSGNPPSEPITTDNDQATSELVADAFLLHDRGIHVANDDSVIRSGPLGPIFVRRSRGYVPDAIRATSLPDRRVLALGAVLKVTVATLCRGQLVVGRHLGDLDNARAESAFEHEVRRMLRFGRIEPEIICVDAHPDLPSTLWAERTFPEVPRLAVQHHHAHLASVMVEHGLGPDDRAVGIVLDGFGHGLDGTIWGGEVLRGGFGGFERVARLRPVAQPGGDRAAVEPRRMATSVLLAAGRAAAGVPGYDERVASICEERSVSPLTSSAGRLFDAVAALCGIAPDVQDYEGEAAALLEAVADPSCDDAYPLPLCEESQGESDRGAPGDAKASAPVELDTRALVCALLDDESPVALRAARFHNGLADGLARAVAHLEEPTVVLAGGALVNRLLGRRLVRALERQGRRVLFPQRLPPGDGGLSAGQAAVGACATFGDDSVSREPS